MRIFSTLLLFCWALVSYAQQSNPDTNQNKALENSRVPFIIPPSPAAASLGRYGDIPVNYSSGLPQPSIPLFSGTDRDLKWNISLNYYYPGYMPVNPPSTLGNGWSLNAGGVITRTIKGHADELTGGNLGYLSSRQYINSLINTDGSLACTSCNQSFINGTYDGEPDMFSFSFGSISGKFFFGEDGLPYIVSDQKLKITYRNIHGGTPVISASFDNIVSFEITDDQGTIYRFGAPATYPSSTSPYITNVEFSRTFSNSGTSNGVLSYITAWYLTEIISNKGGRITFEYSNENLPTKFGENFPNKKEIRVRTSYRLFNVGGILLESQFNEDEIISEQAENFLTRIKADNWQVDMVKQTSGGQSLYTGMLIQSRPTPGTLSTLKRVAFTYSATDHTALLNKVEDFDSNNALINNTHNFAYYGTLPASVSANTFALDYWNYYNGQTSNTNLIPNTVTGGAGGANRNPDLASTQLGALKSITYPTSGTTVFEYEQNQYSYIKGQPYSLTIGGTETKTFTHGGLRLKKQTDYAGGSAPPVVKQYTYNDLDTPGRSSGIINDVIGPYAVAIDLVYECSFTQPPCSTTYTVIKSDPFYVNARNPVYYKHVREQTGTNQVSEYRFTDHSDKPDPMGVGYGLKDTRLGPTTDYSFARSLLKSVSHYDAGTLKYRKTINYQVDDRHLARTFYRNIIFYTQTTGQPISNQKGLATVSGWVKKNSETEAFYTGTASVSTVTKYRAFS